MATLQKRNGKYWYLVESVRVNGKPRPKVLAYLGKAEDLLEKLNGNMPVSSKSYEYGTVAVLDNFIKKLNITESFNKYCKNRRGSIPRRHGLSIGKILTNLIIQRTIHPSSKRSFACWSKKTFLPILHEFDHEKMTSQLFWDMMSYVQDDHMKAIEDSVTKEIFNSFCECPDLMLYDYTNFFTFIDTENDRCDLPQRGKNKQKRNDLRQFSLALLVARKFKIPIFSDVYAGNVADANEFSSSIPKIKERLELLSKGIEDITLVFDKGSNSKDNFDKIKDINYVASLSVFHNKELKRVPFDKFEETKLEDTDNKEAASTLMVYRTQKKIWGTNRTVVMYKSNALYKGQIKGFEADIVKVKNDLEKLKRSIQKGCYKKKGQTKEWTNDLIEEKAEGIINKQFVRDVVEFEIKPSGKIFTLSYKINYSKKNFLNESVFGKRILITSRHNWDTLQIIDAYHGQADVENAFKRLKNPYYHAVRPQYHWTDQKIKVHTFCSILALTVSQLIEKTAHDNGFNMSIHEIFDRLSEIRKVKYLNSNKKKYNIRYGIEEIEDKTTDSLFKVLMSA